VVLLSALLGPWAAGCASTPVAGLPTEARPFGDGTCVVYVTGIGGDARDARSVMTGLRAAGYEGHFRVHDWTGGQWPLAALWNRRHQFREARRLAGDVRRWRGEHPDTRVILLAHSGGAGVALRALEVLPLTNGSRRSRSSRRRCLAGTTSRAPCAGSPRA
jgi:pimeloyl-ACP methyl ester carboxylesterase